MAQATLSIAGLYKFNEHLFDDMYIPESLDRDTVVASIIMETEGLEALYVDIPFMMDAIKYWSITMRHKWDKLVASMNFDYNPIWNKDGVRMHTEEENKSSERDETVADSTASTSNNFGAGFNTTSGLTNRERDTVQNSGQVKTDDDLKESTKRESKDVEQGNIGVTSTQQLIKEEREVADINIYSIIAKDFKNKFCIQVY